MLLLLGRHAALPRDGKIPVLNVDLNLVLGETRQFEGRNHKVLVSVLVQIHPVG